MNDAIPLSPDEVREIGTLHAQGKTVEFIADWIGCSAEQVRVIAGDMPPPPIQRQRTAGGLRDLLFDEIERLQRGETMPQRAMAVSNLAKQIINVAKAEAEFMRRDPAADQNGPLCLGSLRLGSNPVAAADEPQTVE